MRQPSRIEPRWPAALAILAVLVLLAVLSGRVRLLPAWVPYVVVMLESSISLSTLVVVAPRAINILGG